MVSTRRANLRNSAFPSYPTSFTDHSTQNMWDIQEIVRHAMDFAAKQVVRRRRDFEDLESRFRMKSGLWVD
jgi:hypothetical protein